MRRELSKTDVERLFVQGVDEALPTREAALLEADPALQARFDAYRRAVSRLRDAPKEKAPDALASVILRRTRRRRFQLRSSELHAMAWRVPAEVVVPMLLAALVALFMLLASP